jgi:hypothetical protein
MKKNIRKEIIMIEKEEEREREKKHEKTLIRHKKMFVCFFFVNCTMSFSVHFRFIEKNPPDFFFPVGACCDETGGSTAELERNGNVRDFGSCPDDC